MHRSPSRVAHLEPIHDFVERAVSSHGDKTRITLAEQLTCQLACVSRAACEGGVHGQTARSEAGLYSSPPPSSSTRAGYRIDDCR